MKLRNSLILGTLPVVAGALILAIAATGFVLRRAARQEVADALKRTQRVFEEVGAYRRSLIRAQARVMAEEPRLKAVVNTENVSTATLADVARDLRKLTRSDVFIITDGRGRLRIDLANMGAPETDLSHLPMVAAALAGGEGSGAWTDDRRAYQVEAVAMTLGAKTVGVVVTGFALDDGVAEAVFQQTGMDVVVEDGGRVVAASPRQYAAAASAFATLPLAGGRVSELRLGGERVMALAAPVPGYNGTKQLRYVVAGSLDAALAPAYRLLRLLLATLGAALVLGFAWAALAARRLSRPIERLVALTRAIAAGRLDERAPPARIVEVDALARAMDLMTDDLREAREHAAVKQRLEEEMAIASTLQTSILPSTFDVPGLEIAARMLPASEVGGDYFDLIPVAGGCWVGVGDVAGHGLPAGIVMLMVQSATAALVHKGPDALPGEHLVALNAMLDENIQRRLKQDQHVTYTLFRFDRDGTVTFAGAHEDIVVWREAEQRCERIATPGPWLGLMPSIAQLAVNSTLRLAPGDTMVLSTDGITEAMNGARTMYGIHRLCAEVERSHALPVPELRDRLIDAVARWQVSQRDDLTVVVLRRRA
jgi:phosphoserine phosphatase RsbU/P